MEVTNQLLTGMILTFSELHQTKPTKFKGNDQRYCPDKYSKWTMLLGRFFWEALCSLKKKTFDLHPKFRPRKMVVGTRSFPHWEGNFSGAT